MTQPGARHLMQRSSASLLTLQHALVRGLEVRKALAKEVLQIEGFASGRQRLKRRSSFRRPSTSLGHVVKTAAAH